MTDEKTLIQVRGLSKEYGDGVKVHALDHVTFSVQEGEFVAIMGPSGSGKSTLLNMLGAMDRPTEGEISIARRNLATIRDMDSFRAKTVGFVFQMHNLIPTLSATENVETPMIGQPISRKDRRARAQALLQMVGMEARRSHFPNQLSGGERQRVAIARALANQPALILADEPTGNLDTKNGEEILSLMRSLNRELRTTFLIVTHDHTIARQTERILTMRDGCIIRDARVGSEWEEDLQELANSSLGRALQREEPITLKNLSGEELQSLRKLLFQPR